MHLPPSPILRTHGKPGADLGPPPISSRASRHEVAHLFLGLSLAIGRADGSMRCRLSLLPLTRQAHGDRTSRCRRRLAPWRHNPCRGFLAVARALHLERPGEMGKPGIPITAKVPEHDHAFLHGVKLAPAQAGTPHRRSTWPSTGSAENKFSAASPAGTRSPYDNPGDHKKGRR